MLWDKRIAAATKKKAGCGLGVPCRKSALGSDLVADLAVMLTQKVGQFNLPCPKGLGH